jgi:hypothetical protein
LVGASPEKELWRIGNLDFATKSRLSDVEIDLEWRDSITTRLDKLCMILCVGNVTI